MTAYRPDCAVMHIRRAVPYSHRCGRAARLRRNVWRRHDANRAIGGYIKNAVHDLQHYGCVRKVVEEESRSENGSRARVHEWAYDRRPRAF
jgi:hypothetical protein